MDFTYRLAVIADVPALEVLIEASIRGLLPDVLTPEQVEASFETMGLDQGLVRDGTYFAVFDKDIMVGCGGWSRRRTLYGGDHMKGRDDSLADPASEPAKIRAMYTHPDYTRRGIGSLILDISEAAAKAEGFTSIALGATASGILLYEKRGYRVVEEIQKISKDNVHVPNIRMVKPL